MPRYNAYLLRVWRDGPPSSIRWAARLEHLPQGDSLLFTDRTALLAYLEELTDTSTQGARVAPVSAHTSHIHEPAHDDVPEHSPALPLHPPDGEVL